MERQCEGDALPEECIANILSKTTPLDTDQLSLVSKTFYAASQSEIVWDHFLPSDLISIISQSDSYATLLANSPSKRSLYFTLSQYPIIIDNATKSFQLDKKTGKKCYMLAARSLNIVSSDNPQRWKWTTNLPESRFPEVAEIIQVSRFHITGVINTHLLSPKTYYTSYLVFKPINANLLPYPRHTPVMVALEAGEAKQESKRYVKIAIVGDKVSDDESSTPTNDNNFDLDLEESVINALVKLQHYPLHYSRVRSDEFLEIEIGDFYVSGTLDAELRMRVVEPYGGDWMRGLVIEGIEVRPKEHNEATEYLYLG